MNWGALEMVMVQLVIGLLKTVTKNPKSVKAEGSIVSQIAQAATEADTAANGTVWSSTAAPSAT